MEVVEREVGMELEILAVMDSVEVQAAAEEDSVELLEDMQMDTVARSTRIPL